jgi:hypothetical protein
LRETNKDLILELIVVKVSLNFTRDETSGKATNNLEVVENQGKVKYKNIKRKLKEKLNKEIRHTFNDDLKNVKISSTMDIVSFFRNFRSKKVWRLNVLIAELNEQRISLTCKRIIMAVIKGLMMIQSQKAGGKQIQKAKTSKFKDTIFKELLKDMK